VRIYVVDSGINYRHVEFGGPRPRLQRGRLLRLQPGAARHHAAAAAVQLRRDRALADGHRAGVDRRITAAEPTGAILTHLGLPTTAPPLSPARGPPQHDLAFDADPGFDVDQTPACDPSEPEPVPDFDFDGSAGA
jgi:hypothetical protein